MQSNTKGPAGQPQFGADCTIEAAGAEQRHDLVVAETIARQVTDLRGDGDTARTFLAAPLEIPSDVQRGQVGDGDLTQILLNRLGSADLDLPHGFNAYNSAVYLSIKSPSVPCACVTPDACN